MKLRKYINKYNEYERKELARRVEKKKKLVAYRALKNKPIVGKKPKRKFSKEAFVRAIGNPYGTKFPKVKKLIKKIKRKKLRKKKVIIVYR